MRVDLLGYKNVDFNDDKGKSVKGTKVFVAYEQDNVQGRTASDFFINDNRIDIIAVDLAKLIDQQIEVETDFKGRVLSVTA